MLRHEDAATNNLEKNIQYSSFLDDHHHLLLDLLSRDALISYFKINTLYNVNLPEEKELLPYMKNIFRTISIKDKRENSFTNYIVVIEVRDFGSIPDYSIFSQQNLRFKK